MTSKAPLGDPFQRGFPLYKPTMKPNNRRLDTDHPAAHRIELMALLYRKLADLVREVQDVAEKFHHRMAEPRNETGTRLLCPHRPPAGRSFNHGLRRDIISAERV